MAKIQNPATATPAEIDAERFRLYLREGTLRQKLMMSVLDMHRVAGDEGLRQPGYRKATTWDWDRVLETLIVKAVSESEARTSMDRWAKVTIELSAIQAEISPLGAEFTRRGGWTQAFLVQGANGHVHRSMHCSTCNNGENATQFIWMTEYSGKTEEEIVEAAGSRACTVCYPSAPVEVLNRPTKMFGPDEIEAQKARDERQAKAAEKARIAADKSITTPEGGQVHIYRDFRRSDVAKTLRTAEIALTDAIYELIREQQHSVDPEWEWFYANGRTTTEKEQASYAALIGHLLWAIAFKKGLETKEVFETHLAKAEAKIRKGDREWAKDFRNPNRVK